MKAKNYKDLTNTQLVKMITEKVKGLAKKRGHRLIIHVLLKCLVPVPYRIADYIMTKKEGVFQFEYINVGEIINNLDENPIQFTDKKALLECQNRLKEIEKIIDYEDTTLPEVQEKLENERQQITKYILECTIEGKIRSFKSHSYNCRKRVITSIQRSLDDIKRADMELGREIERRIRYEDKGVCVVWDR